MRLDFFLFFMCQDGTRIVFPVHFLVLLRAILGPSSFLPVDVQEHILHPVAILYVVSLAGA